MRKTGRAQKIKRIYNKIKAKLKFRNAYAISARRKKQFLNNIIGEKTLIIKYDKKNRKIRKIRPIKAISAYYKNK